MVCRMTHMFKHLHLVLVIWALAISSVQAKTYIRDYTYKASDADSKISSRTNALDQVKLILLQEIGTHIRQEINITKDGSGNSYASEDVEAITAGLTKVEIMDEKWNGETYYLKAKIDADTTRVLNALEAFKNEKSKESERQLQSLKDNQRKLKESREEIAKLRKQLTQASSSEKEKILVKYIDRVEQISLSDIFIKGYDFYHQGQYDDAVYWFREAADQGDASAQYYLAVMYENGLGIERSVKQAVAWHRKAADQGIARSLNALVWTYATCVGGVKCDSVKAVYWAVRLLEKIDTLSNHAYLDSIAAAYARADDFDKAIKYQKMAMTFQSKNKDEYSVRLKLYQSGKPYSKSDS